MIPDYVVLTDSINRSLKNILSEQNYTSIGLLCDENTYEYCYPIIKGDIQDHHLIKIRSGEENKTLASCADVWKSMTKNRLDRKSLLINLGGGVIGDMGGFCAATYKRGIDFIQIPTTLLAQVDASIGGKLGIDFDGVKNHIGIFKLPHRVIIDPVFLKTLPFREIRSGYAEMIKHGLIHDRKVFEDLQKRGKIPDEQWLPSVKRSIEIKSEIAGKDPFETGARKLLNFGHTIGHALESHFLSDNDSKLLHGEAIAIGMICEAWLSREKSGLPDKELNEICNFILKIYGKADLREIDENIFLRYLKQDKKNKGDELLFTLLNKIGKGVIDVPVNYMDTIASLEYYTSL